MKIIKLPAKYIGERLDKFLALKLKNLSRSQIQKLINSENILVNEKPINSHYILKNGDSVAIKATQRLNDSTTQPQEKEKQVYSFQNYIIKETPDYIVINKPSDLIAHNAAHIKESTLTDWLTEYYPKIKKIGDDPMRPGIVHRLDKDVSGLMVIAKNQKSFEDLKKQFMDRKTKKRYTALVYGKINKLEDEINFPIKRSTDGYKMAAIPETFKKDNDYTAKYPEARIAKTKFKVLKNFINYTLLKVEILTGRTHQIRCHLGAYGHPIVGDNLYSTKRTREQNKKIGLGRVFLVADELSFADLNGEQQIFKIDIPEELKSLLQKIK